MAAALRQTLERATARADSIEAELRPQPLLTPAEEAGLRRFSNAAHVARARALGVSVEDEAGLEAALADGRLVALEASTRHWIVREEGVSRGLVTPATRALLEEVADRFHAELEGRGLPPYRLEVSSALRTPAAQAALRARNPNAARGVSAHQFGTTVDIAYEAFAPPLELPSGLLPDDVPEDLRTQLEAVAALALESVAARKSRELKALLGHVLRDLQEEGAVLVTLERQQPVYHITVARRVPAD